MPSLGCRISGTGKRSVTAIAQNFTWLGRPVIQTPLDLYAYQELIWACRPDLIIETGIAHGGSLIMSASMLALVDYCDAIQKGGSVLDPKASRRKAVGIDIDIRAHNRAAIDAHPLRHKIQLIEGSSIAPGTMSRSRTKPRGYDRSWSSSTPTTPMSMSSPNSSFTHLMSAKAPIASSGIPASRTCRIECARIGRGARAIIQRRPCGNI